MAVQAGQLEDDGDESQVGKREPETINPRFSASRSGAAEKLTTPSVANFSILVRWYFVSPAKRSSRWKLTPTWRNPIQLNIPRT